MRTSLRTYFRGATLAAVRDEVAGKNSYYHFDHQGTTQFLTDSTGAVTDTYASDAWGNQVKRTGTSINRRWYIGGAGADPQVDNNIHYAPRAIFQTNLGRRLSRPPGCSSVVCVRYPFGANMPARSAIVAEVAVAPVEFDVELRRFFGPPRVTDKCGGAIWKVLWGINPQPSAVHRSTLRGFYIQHVTIKSEMSTCTDPVMGLSNVPAYPATLDYYEAWPYVWDASNPFQVPGDWADDTFRFPGTPMKPTQGSWTITGETVFIEAEALPDDAVWMPKEKCDQLYPSLVIGLQCSQPKKDPRAFAAAKVRIKRELTMTWHCPCGGVGACVVDECGGFWSRIQGNAEPIKYKVTCVIPPD